MAVSGELPRSNLLGSSVKNINDKTLIRELTRRGYHLTNLRHDDETTTEIVKVAI